MAVSPLLWASLGLQGASLLASLLQKRRSPEDIYRERVDRAIARLTPIYADREARLRAFAERETGLARQRGGREAASLGYAGAPSIFSAPAEWQISTQLADALESLGLQKREDIARIQSAELGFPITYEPATFDYISAILAAGGRGLGLAYEAGQQAEMLQAYKDYLGRLGASPSGAAVAPPPSSPFTMDFQPTIVDLPVDVPRETSRLNRELQGYIDQLFSGGIGRPPRGSGFGSRRSPFDFPRRRYDFRLR